MLTGENARFPATASGLSARSAPTRRVVKPSLEAARAAFSASVRFGAASRASAERAVACPVAGPVAPASGSEEQAAREEATAARARSGKFFLAVRSLKRTPCQRPMRRNARLSCGRRVVPRGDRANSCLGRHTMAQPKSRTVLG